MNPLLNLRVLNSREKKSILNLFQERYCVSPSKDYVFLLNKENKLFLINKLDINLNNLRVNYLGLYIGQIKDKNIRLSIEGSQLLKPIKNTLEVTKEQADSWMRGESIESKESFQGFVAIKHGQDYLGSGNYKQGKILNYVPKERRIHITPSQKIFKLG